MTLKTASMSLSSTETENSVIYYSRYYLIPALLAAIRHCLPAITLADSIGRAREYLSGNLPQRNAAHLGRYGNAAGGETVYAATAAIPTSLVERTLVDFLEIAGSGRERCIVGAGLPALCRCILGPCRHDHTVQWHEIGNLVEQLRLRLQAGYYRNRL